MSGKTRTIIEDYSMTLFNLYNALYKEKENPYTGTSGVFGYRRKIAGKSLKSLIDDFRQSDKDVPFLPSSKYKEALDLSRGSKPVSPGSQMLFFITHLGGWRSNSVTLSSKINTLFHDHKSPADGGARSEFFHDLLDWSYTKNDKGEYHFFRHNEDIGKSLSPEAKSIAEYIVEYNYFLISSYCRDKDVLKEIVSAFAENMSNAEENRSKKSKNNLFDEHKETIERLCNDLDTLLQACNDPKNGAETDWFLARALSWLLIGAMLRGHLSIKLLDECLKPYMPNNNAVIEPELAPKGNGENKGKDTIGVQHNEAQVLVGNLNSMPNKKVFGREKDLKSIPPILDTPEGMVFLYGEPGIGKTHLAKKYAISSSEKYSTLIFAQYENSLVNLVCDDTIFLIKGFQKRGVNETTEEYYRRKMQCIRSIVSEKILIILDNYDEDDERFEEFISLNCKKIITTRNKHDEYAENRLHVDVIKDENFLFEIFEYYYYGPNSQRKLSSEEKPVISDIIHMVESHTYAIELIAKQMKVSHMTAEEMRNQLQEGIKSLPQEGFKAKGSKGNAFNHLCALYNISNLRDIEKQVLRCLSLMGISGIDVRKLKEWVGLDTFDPINQLKDRGWIREEYKEQEGEEGHGQNDSKHSLHPLAIEVIHAILTPDENNCEFFIKKINGYLYDTWARDYSENVRIRNNIEYLITYFSNIDFTKYEMFSLFGNFMWQIGEFRKSIQYYQKIYDDNCRDTKADKYLLALLEEDLAGAYFNSGLEQESKEYYEKALQHFSESTSENDPDFALSYEKVARCYTWYFCRDYGTSLAYITKALKLRIGIYEGLEQGEYIKDRYSEYRKYNKDIAYSAISSCLASIGKLFQSMGCYLTALPFFFDEYNCIKTNRFTAQNNLSYNLCNTAKSCYEIGRWIDFYVNDKNSVLAGWHDYYNVLMEYEKEILNQTFTDNESARILAYLMRMCKGRIQDKANDIKENILTVFHDQYPNQDTDEIVFGITAEYFFFLAKYFIGKAESIIQMKRGDSQVDAITFKVLSADIYYATGDKETADSKYREAINIAEKILDKNNPHLTFLQMKLDNPEYQEEDHVHFR